MLKEVCTTILLNVDPDVLTKRRFNDDDDDRLLRREPMLMDDFCRRLKWICMEEAC